MKISKRASRILLLILVIFLFVAGIFKLDEQKRREDKFKVATTEEENISMGESSDYSLTDGYYEVLYDSFKDDLIPDASVDQGIGSLFGLPCRYTTIASGAFHERYYYCDELSDQPIQVGNSFGWKIDDYITDIDGDGITELICNSVYNADSCQRLWIYRRADNKLQYGVVDETLISNLPGYVHTVAGNVIARYCSDIKKVFITYYSTDGMTEGFFSFPELNIDYITFHELQ